MAVRLPRPSDVLTPSAIHSAPFGNARFVLNKCEDWHDHCYWVAWWPSLSERSAILRGRQLYTREYEARIDLDAIHLDPTDAAPIANRHSSHNKPGR